MNARVVLLFLFSSLAFSQSSATSPDWELVRSVPNGVGSTIDLVHIPDAKQRDRKYYLEIANEVCGKRTTCMVNFWTNRAHIPEANSGWIPVADLAEMTAIYERHPNYKEPVLNLACWLYPNKVVAEADKCAYFPGAKKPPDK